MYHTLEPSPADIGGAVRRRTHRISLRMQRAAARSRTSTGIHAAYVENCKASMQKDIFSRKAHTPAYAARSRWLSSFLTMNKEVSRKRSTQLLRQASSPRPKCEPMDEVMHWSQQRSVKACTVDCMRALDCSESRNVLNSFWSASDRFWLMTATKTTTCLRHADATQGLQV